MDNKLADNELTNEVEKTYELLIIGSGPAGLSAAVYAARAEMDFAVIAAEPMGGGQILNTESVDNYLGLNGINGFDMGMKFDEHAKAMGAEFIYERVCKTELSGNIKTIITESGKAYRAKNVILSTGASHRKLEAEGEKEFTGKGVSYCATCDGAFFRGMDAAVIGGGDVALGDALYLSKLCNKVYLVHRRDEFRAAKAIISKVKSTQNIETVLDSTVALIGGGKRVEYCLVTHKKNGEQRKLDVSAVFVAVGMVPDTSYVDDCVLRDESGYIIAGEDCRTNVSGVYVAGDLRTKNLRQVITAAADGAVAISSIEADTATEG